MGNLNNKMKDYIVVLQHPVTTEYEDTRKNIKETIKSIQNLNLPTIWLWPNIDAGNDIISKEIRKFREKINPKNILFVKNFSPEDFLKVLMKSKCIVGNSSVAIRECSFLGVPAVNIGSRQNGREHGENVKFCDYNSAQIIRFVKEQIR